jgi:U6 snRNA-associated Sm-like protein LSm8
MASSLAEWKDSECEVDMASLTLYFQLQEKLSRDTESSFTFVFYCSIILIVSFFFCSSFFFWNTESICVITSDGRIILGDLIGHDQVQNLILNDAKERVYSNGSSPEEVDLGLYVIRGDNVCMVADYIADLWTDDSVAPLAPIRQQEKI